MTTPKQKIGAIGEALAQAHLKRNGYDIVALNWRCKHGEIDIVARASNGILAFCEVKTRKGTNVEDAQLNFTERKRSRLLATIYAYLSEQCLPDEGWRVDLIAIALPYDADPILEHTENCLEW
jgi:putative endonuclease